MQVAQLYIQVQTQHKKTSAEPAVNSADVFTAYTSATLEKVSESNYVAPIIPNGPAYGKVSTPRALTVA